MQVINDAAKTFRVPKDIRNLIMMEKLGITQEDLDMIKHSYAYGAKPKRLQPKPTQTTLSRNSKLTKTGPTAATLPSKASMLKDSSINKIYEDNDEYRESFYLTHAHINVDSSHNLLKADPSKMKSSLFANLVKSQIKQLNLDVELNKTNDYSQANDQRIVLPPLNAQSHVSFEADVGLKSASTTARGAQKYGNNLLSPAETPRDYAA
jgi:hypothetical protein